jgi:glyoxylase-like metal-dependent hydrolase (beta-lactamase superfamily II)
MSELIDAFYPPELEPDWATLDMREARWLSSMDHYYRDKETVYPMWRWVYPSHLKSEIEERARQRNEQIERERERTAAVIARQTSYTQ